MLTEIYANYKVKSVGYFPMSVFFYRLVEVLIDEAIATVLNLPTIFCISCYRNDVVFLLYMIQRWMYRVDPNRSDIDDYMPNI